MKTRTTSSLLALGLLFACDEPPPTDNEADTSVEQDAAGDVAADTVEADVAEEVGVDASEDVATDVVEDTAPDVEEVGVDVADVAPDGSGDAGSEDVVEDTTEDVEVEDAGTACDDDPSICVAPYTCLDEVCRIPLSGTTWAESEFDIVEPEELTRLFTTLKSFTGDVRFLVFDIGEGTTALGAEYGSADLVEGESELPLVSFQNGGALTGNVIVRALEDAEDPLNGDGWITDPFLYQLRAVATVAFPGTEPVTAGFGLDAEDVRVTMIVGQEEDPALATALLVGVVTREETEGRSMVDEEELPAFRTLFCSPGSDHDPEGTWHLSDLLDCNGAEMDADYDGDGENDAYVVVIEAEFEPAILIE